MKKLACCLVAFVLLLSVTVVTNSYCCEHWKVKWEYKGSNVSSYDPNVKHYMWETARPPYGPWDKIALHRYVRQHNSWDDDPYAPAPNPRKVFFINPGTWDRGYQSEMNPNTSQFWYFAGQGYDLYSISFRTEYIPNFAPTQFADFGLANELAATAGWTYGVFREDIKACVDLAKKISRAKKIFMGGVSRGGTHMFIYASKYANDLKGLVSFDGGGAYVNVNPSAQMTKSAFDAAVAALGTSSGLPYLSEIDNYDLHQFSGAVPFATTEVGAPLPDISTLVPPIPSFAPADKNRMTYVSDLTAYKAYWLWGAGLVCNYYEPYPGGNGETYMDQKILIEIEALLTRYWPNIQTLEGSFMANYLSNPYLDYQNPNINLPFIFFASELSCPKGSCLSLPPTYQPRTQSKDITTIYLPKYGHLDVFSGTHSLQDIKQPALDWMNQRLGHH
jgi:pimeloyl-ACP methyl ester carboxylesterase